MPPAEPGLVDRMTDGSPPGPFQRRFWRSPIRGPWLTSIFGAVLLVGIPLMFLTGLFSYAAYNPRLGFNDITPRSDLLSFYLFRWPAGPSWLYRLNQGLHVTLGLVLVPVILAKLWSVIPKLFDWPPVRSPAQALERLTLLLLVAGAGFEFATGLVNIQYWYVFPGSFYTAHLYGAWIFMAAFVGHAALKFPVMWRSLKSRSLRQELRTDLAGTEPEPPDPDDLVSPDPAPATISRRGALGLVSAGSLTLLVLSVGQNLGGVFRKVALLSPRGRPLGDGPNDFQVNKPADAVGITQADVGPSWRLELRGPSPQMLSRDDLLAMDQHTADLAIACVEGWSTGVQTWTGVRLRDLARRAGAADADAVFVESLQTSPGFGSTTLAGNQIRAGDSLLALRVNGVDLSLDHGFPARVIVPANPGVHNTKWVNKLSFDPDLGDS